MTKIPKRVLPKLFPLLLIFTTVIISGTVATTSYYSNLQSKKIHKEKIVNVTNRMLIGAAIMCDLQQLETLFYKLGMTVAPQQKQVSVLYEDTQRTIFYVHHLLDILEKGGTVSKEFSPNVVGLKEVALDIPYRVPQGQHYIVDVLELRPGLVAIEEKMKELAEVTSKRNRLIIGSQNPEDLRDESLRMRQFVKSAEPLFLRVSENASRLYFDGEKSLQALLEQLAMEHERERQNNLYRTALSAIVVLLFIWVALRQILSNWRSLEDQVAERTKELVISKEEWEKTFDAIPDIITLQDRNRKIVRANQATFDFFKIEPEELLNMTCYQLFRGSSQLCIDCTTMSASLSGRKMVHIVEHRDLGKVFRVTSAPIFDDSNEMQYTVYVAQDVTETIAIEKELVQAQKMQAVGTLAGGIAHDFNNILAAILGYAEIIKSNIPANSADEKYLNRLIGAGNRATELVKQILTFSRSSSQEKKPVRIDSVVKEATKMMRASLPTNIEIEASIASQCGLVLADPTTIHQIVVNLCTNASHAIGKENGTIEVALHKVDVGPAQLIGKTGVQPGVFICLTVNDTGKGMDAKIVERIFEPYFSTRKHGEGAGLGLAVTHGIVEKCQGFISVESAPGAGSTFSIYLPCVEDGLPATAPVATLDSLLPRGTERILIVDDEPNIMEIESLYLTQLGYKVTTAKEGLHALDVFSAAPESFDLIITDQTMPGLSGGELARAILKLRKNIPIILCTGFTSVLSADEVYAIGIKKFLVKPISKRDLAEEIRQVLDKKA